MNIILSSIGALKNPKESARITLFLLAQELKHQGHDVVIIAKGHGREEMCGIPIYRTSPFKIPFLLHSLHRERKIDIIHSFSASPLFLLPHLLAPGKKIHTLKSYSKTRIGRKGYLLLALADAVTVPTHVYQARLPYTKNVEVIYSPIDTAKFLPQDKDKLKKKYGYHKNKIVIYYGALWKNKGVDILIQAISKVIQEIPQVKFIFLPRYAQIGPEQKQVSMLGMEKCVEFITKDVVIEDYVNLADAVVLPYRNLIGTEGNPSCMLEAMACKTAVITSDLPELREIGDERVELVEPGKVNELAYRIVQVLTHQNQKKIEKAFEKAQEFSCTKIAGDFSELYAGFNTNSDTRKP